MANYTTTTPASNSFLLNPVLLDDLFILSNFFHVTDLCCHHPDLDRHKMARIVRKASGIYVILLVAFDHLGRIPSRKTAPYPYFHSSSAERKNPCAIFSFYQLHGFMVCRTQILLIPFRQLAALVQINLRPFSFAPPPFGEFTLSPETSSQVELL
jgi:hypothetical protein